IAKLISGFYKINEGKILIGGHDLKEYSEKVLLENIAFVFQNSKLFKTSIYENVRIGNPNASYEEIMKALEAARCNEILDKFKERENTIIGSKGVYLSGGEVQRIAIARAILKDAKIIILDEASAAADPENEFELQRAFSVLMKNKTVIMIAHRLSSIKNVDEVLYIEDGRVVEKGTHNELMKLDGRYKTLQDLYNQANKWRIA
ncbi:TPA: ATP-binding cassette domain-containing protein, partial [Streptococcus agalactiae]|nr:ATP-binding cassette domain-containing protein [Streptococcus agalactiae]